MFIKLLKEIGRGKRGARDLNHEEAMTAARLILSSQASAAQIGAFLVAARVKMESITELEAFIKVCRETAFRQQIPRGLDCSGPYDGRNKSFHASFATAFILAAAGLPVTLHGSQNLPPKRGVTIHDMLSLAGIKPNVISQQHLLNIAQTTGLLYVPAESWCPPLAAIRSIREELDMRTIFNTVEKLIDYAYSPYLVFGVFHNTVFNRIGEVVQRLGYEKTLIIQGTEGSEDLFIDRPTRMYYVDQNRTELQIIDPERYGLDIQIPNDIVWDVDSQVLTVEEVLQDQAHPAFRHQVLINAAVRLHLSDKANSIEQGLYISKSILEQGSAWQVYTHWKQAMQEATVVDTIST